MLVTDGPRFMGATDIIPSMATSTISTEGVDPLAIELARVRGNLTEFKIGKSSEPSNKRVDFVLKGSSNENAFRKRPRLNVEGGSSSSGQAHRVTSCLRRRDRCYRCGQSGHLRRDCPRGNGPLRDATSPLVTSLQAVGGLVSDLTQPMNVPIRGSSGMNFSLRGYLD
uniref:CCHC-type domain-containing protein n=1 Tax=Ananas comosus var. bracteatus TaxID=296719 RepID=A0A6V7QM52_ANACO|nr:unnamed protein product [Ananas comosus var. bracteatus]